MKTDLISPYWRVSTTINWPKTSRLSLRDPCFLTSPGCLSPSYCVAPYLYTLTYDTSLFLPTKSEWLPSHSDIQTHSSRANVSGPTVRSLVWTCRVYPSVIARNMSDTELVQMRDFRVRPSSTTYCTISSSDFSQLSDNAVRSVLLHSRTVLRKCHYCDSFPMKTTPPLLSG